MAGLPPKPPSGLAPLASGWTEHKAPTGHSYYYNSETQTSTYTRPVAQTQSFHHPQTPTAPRAPNAPPNISSANPAGSYGGNYNQYNLFSDTSYPLQQHSYRGGFQQSRGGHRGGHNNPYDRRKSQPEDRPKHRVDIPGCEPWVLVKTKLGRRFVWNRDTNESFWKFPENVMKGVVEFDRVDREKRERTQRGELGEDEDSIMAEVEEEVAATEAEIRGEEKDIDGLRENAEDSSEYEEVEVTDDEGEEVDNPPKRQRTEEPLEDQPMEMGEDDIAWQLAAMEEGYGDEEEEGLPLTEEDCQALFKDLLDDIQINPYSTWEKIIEEGQLFDDERYKAMPNMKARKDCWSEWSKERIQALKEQRERQEKKDPKIPYLAFLQKYATPKLFWPEFRRKYKKESEMKDMKVSDKDREKLYREHINRLKLPQVTLKSDLSTLLKSQPLSMLNRSSSLANLPPSLLTDLRYISLPASTRDSLVESYISTLPAAPEGVSAEDELETAKRRSDRERREKALAERERRVEEQKRKQQRELEYGKGRLREEEMEIERAMKVGKEGLRAQLES